jgi:hypothetical protein
MSNSGIGPQNQTDNKMIPFDNDDVGYLDWINTHPNGYVLNVRSFADPEYVVLHRASCVTIRDDRHVDGAFTGRGFRKVCATSVEALEPAARQQGRNDGSPSKRCSLCKP